MKLFLIFFLSALLIASSEGMTNWLTHQLYPCVQCLCHARSGCWIRQNCARYSISEDYWRKAGSLTVHNDEDADKNAYSRCMADENCIVGTVIKYTESFGNMDCNCDGKFDCKDRAAIHLKGENCDRPEYGRIYASRFNECAARTGVTTMLAQEGEPTCVAAPIVY